MKTSGPQFDSQERQFFLLILFKFKETLTTCTTWYNRTVSIPLIPYKGRHKKKKSSNCMSVIDRIPQIACRSLTEFPKLHVHMLPLHVRNEYACPHDTTPTCPDVKTHVWNLMFHNCMSNMHSEINCMSTRYLCVKLHVHVAKCMSQNCHYANCMSNMQFKSELHVHNLKIFMMGVG